VRFGRKGASQIRAAAATSGPGRKVNAETAPWQVNRLYAKVGGMETTRLKIAKLGAATDTAHLQKALEAVPQVGAVEIDAEAHEAVVEHDGADTAQMTAALKNQGYISEPVRE
jgi:copper chaperone CopZ